MPRTPIVLFTVALALALAAPAHASDAFHWSAPQRIDAATRLTDPIPLALACASSTVCVGVGEKGTIASSTQPASPAAWDVGHLGDTDFARVSCTPSSLCLAVGLDGTIVRSTDPAAGPASWSSLGQPLGRLHFFRFDDGPDVACPTTSLCVIVGGNEIATTTDPAASVPTWTAHELRHPLILERVDCPSASA
jgi:hypothetical protein